MNPDAQKVLTWFIGVVAAGLVWVAGHVHIGLPEDVANYMAMAIVSGVTGYVKQHFAEKEALCPQCALERAAERATQLQALMKSPPAPPSSPPPPPSAPKPPVS